MIDWVYAYKSVSHFIDVNVCLLTMSDDGYIADVRRSAHETTDLVYSEVTVDMPSPRIMVDKSVIRASRVTMWRDLHHFYASSCSNLVEIGSQRV